uniref:Uncharacterized protein n=1 Tax=Aegilops tauschii subsp. strangulata TaxID=200361 RepID=A0A453MK86_AEGTS
ICEACSGKSFTSRPLDGSSPSTTQLNVPPTLATSVESTHPYEKLLSNGQVFIRSTRLLERRSKKRNVPQASTSSTDVVQCSVADSKKKEKPKKYGRVLGPDEPFRLFLRDRETTEFLTAKEERHLFSQIQNLMKLEEAQRRLEAQCGREPTLPEWAQAVGMSCKELQSSIHMGRRCREKMARSNFRLVIHVARKYQGYGLDIEDLVQSGRMLWVDENLREIQSKQGMQVPHVCVLVDTPSDQKVYLQAFETDSVAGECVCTSEKGGESKAGVHLRRGAAY